MVLYLTDDLLFSSQITSAAKSAGIDIELLMSATQLAERLAAAPSEIRLVIVDLGMSNLSVSSTIALIRSTHPDVHILAYGPHVQVDKLAEAQRVGCNSVLARGAFSRDGIALIRQVVGAMDL